MLSPRVAALRDAGNDAAVAGPGSVYFRNEIAFTAVRLVLSAATVRAGALDGLQQLTRLDLSFNVIGSVEGGALGGLTRLQELNLCHNRITKLNSDVFEGEYAIVPCAGVRCAVRSHVSLTHHHPLQEP